MGAHSIATVLSRMYAQPQTQARSFVFHPFSLLPMDTPEAPTPAPLPTNQATANQTPAAQAAAPAAEANPAPAAPTAATAAADATADAPAPAAIIINATAAPATAATPAPAAAVAAAAPAAAAIPATEVTALNHLEVGTAAAEAATRLTFSIPIEISVSTPLQHPANSLEQPTNVAPTAAPEVPAPEKGAIGFQYAAARDDEPDTPNDQVAPAEPAPL
ncbi:hypothetical protein GCM10027044_28370 [Hymenobacter ruber]